jgi:hypothetical protein
VRVRTGNLQPDGGPDCDALSAFGAAQAEGEVWERGLLAADVCGRGGGVKNISELWWKILKLQSCGEDLSNRGNGINMGNLIVDLKFELPLGADKESNNEQSALFRPLRQLVKHGKPIGNINYLFLKTEGDYRVLGSVCFSPGKQLVFFPGIQGTYMKAYDGKSKLLANYDPFLVDHFTLEPKFKKWHITENKTKAGRVQNLKTREISPGLFAWFGMSVRQEHNFESLYRVNKWTFEYPEGDVERRLDDIRHSRDNSIFHVITPNGNNIKKHKPYFLHFDFLVNKGLNASTLPSEIIRVPEEPLAKKMLTESDRIETTYHDIKIPGFDNLLVIVATYIPGTLSEKFILSFQ